MKMIILLSLFTLAACGISPDKSALKFADQVIAKIDPIKNEPAETDQNFLKLKADLFDRSCNNCHNPKKPKRLDLTKKENVIREYDDILYRMTEAFDMGFDNMPPEGDKVSDSLIAEFKQWKASLNP
jgi:cytochrome c5